MFIYEAQGIHPITFNSYAEAYDYMVQDVPALHDTEIVGDTRYIYFCNRRWQVVYATIRQA